MGRLRELTPRVHPPIALTQRVHYPLADVQVRLILFIHTMREFDENDKNERNCGSIVNTVTAFSLKINPKTRQTGFTIC